LILINHENTYGTGMLGHLCPRCPPFKELGGSAPVMHPRSGVPGHVLEIYNFHNLPILQKGRSTVEWTWWRHWCG